MKKRFLKILGILLAAAGILSAFTACGTSDRLGNGSEAPDTSNEAAQSAPVGKDAEPKVESEIEYSVQAVDIRDPSKAYDWVHSISLPRLVWDSENAEKFNEGIMEDYSGCLRALENAEEGDELYSISYQYVINGDIAAIVIKLEHGRQYRDVSSSYSGYYFDTMLDREISADEYIRAMGGEAAQLFGRAVSQLYTRESGLISCEAGDAVLFDYGFVVELDCTSSNGDKFSRLVRVDPSESADGGVPDPPIGQEGVSGPGSEAEPETVGWVTTVHGHKFYIPEGFEETDMGLPPSGHRYTYYNEELDMSITVWESTIHYIPPFSTGKEWIDSDYASFEQSDCVYLTRGETYLVASGYDMEGDVYYLREQFSGDLIYTYNIVNGTEFYDECSDLTGQFAKNFQTWTFESAAN